MNKENQSSRITVDESRLFGYPDAPIQQNALASLEPDEWKNIPVCVVSAFKQVVAEVIRLDKKSIEMVKTADDQKRKQLHQFKIVDKDIHRVQEDLLGEIEKTNQQQRHDYQTTRYELDTQLDKSRMKLESLESEFNANFRLINSKLGNVEESGEMRNYISLVIEETIDQMKMLINLQKETLHDRITKITNQNLIVPGLIGEYEKYSNVKEYIQKTYFENKNRIEEIDRKQGDLGREVQSQTTAQFYSHFKKIDDQFAEMQANFEALDVEKSLIQIKESLTGDQAVFGEKLNGVMTHIDKVKSELMLSLQEKTESHLMHEEELLQKDLSLDKKFQEFQTQLDQMNERIKQEALRNARRPNNLSNDPKNRAKRQISSVNESNKASIESTKGEMQGEIEDIKRQLKLIMRSNTFTSKKNISFNAPTARSGVGEVPIKFQQSAAGSCSNQDTPKASEVGGNNSLGQSLVLDDNLGNTKYDLVDIHDEGVTPKNEGVGTARQPSISVSYYHNEDPSKEDRLPDENTLVFQNLQDDFEKAKHDTDSKLAILTKKVERIEKKFNFLQRQSTNLSNSSGGDNMKTQWNQMKSVLKSGALKSMQSINEKRSSLNSKTEQNSPRDKGFSPSSSLRQSPVMKSTHKEGIVVPQAALENKQTDRDHSQNISFRAISEESTHSKAPKNGKLAENINNIAQSSFLVKAQDPLDQGTQINQSATQTNWRRSLIPSAYEPQFPESRIKSHIKNNMILQNARYDKDLKNTFRMPPLVNQSQKMTPMKLGVLNRSSKSSQGRLSVRVTPTTYAVEFDSINQLDHIQ